MWSNFGKSPKMKTFSIVLTTAALVSSVSSNPLPANIHYRSDNITGPNANSSKPDFPPSCAFYDGHGPVHCTAFSVIFGDNHNKKGNKAESKTQVQIMGYNFKINLQLSCDHPDEFQGFTSPLPFVLSIRPGNACYETWTSEWYFDNTVSRVPLLPAHLR